MQNYFLVVLILFTFFSCEPGGPGSGSEKGEKINPSELSQVYKEVKLEGYYTLEVPEDLVETDKLNELANLQYFSVRYQFGVMILNEDINESKDGMKILNPKLEESNVDMQFLDKYLQFQLNNLKSIIKEYDYPNVKRTTLSGRDARTFEITAGIDGEDGRFVFCGTAVEGRSQVYYIYLFYPAEKQEDYQPHRDHILETFTLNERYYNVESEEEVSAETDEEYIEEEEEIEEYEENDYSTGKRPKQSKKSKHSID